MAMLNQSPNHNIMLTLIPNRTLKVTPNGKVLKKAKKRKVTKVRFEPKTNGILDLKHNYYTMSSTLIA